MMMLSRAANMIHGEFRGKDTLFSGVSKDTRSIVAGDLYIAIKGEHFDGHNFIDQASQAGAAGALVSEYQSHALPQICVQDTRAALGSLAYNWREQFKGSIIGITGSNGKTTVKEMCSSILRTVASDEHVVATKGNLNNDIGMPMTLLTLRKQHRYAVIEMGANHVGEIAYLTSIARPTVALITNAGPAHLEGFGSIENVAKAKAEIYGGLDDQGIAVINDDDKYSSYWKGICKGKKILTFSMKNKSADVYMKYVENKSCFLNTPSGNQEIKLALPGVHNVMNAAAATTACIALNIGINDIAAGLSAFAGVPGRLAITDLNKGGCIIDDSYNANPSSLNAAINVLVGMQGESWLIIGDMLELGESAKELHREIGENAKKAGVKRLYATGNFSRYAVEAYGKGATYFEDRAELVKTLKQEVRGTEIILVKGSRTMKMEEVVNALLDKNNNKSGEVV